MIMGESIEKSGIPAGWRARQGGMDAKYCQQYNAHIYNTVKWLYSDE